LGSNQAIPRPGSLFQQKVIAKVIAKLKHLDDQERKRQRNVEQKASEKIKGKRRKGQEKETKKKGQIKNREIKQNKWKAELDSKSILIYFRIQLHLNSLEIKTKGKRKERHRKGNKG
jgi:hypothetical protein